MDASAAVEELFVIYKDEVYRYALFTLGNAREAEDTVQEVFIRAFRAWHSFRHDAHPRTWLWSITRNCLADVTRQKKRKSETMYASLDSIEALSMEPSNLSEWEDVLNRLSLAQRQVIYWRIIQDMTVSETAERLGWSAAKVRITLHRSVRALRRLVATEGWLQAGKVDG